MSQWEPPPRFDGYELAGILGEGGMGRVYVARDTLLEREVAIKFISAGAPDEEAKQRFLIEARAIARLQQPNVVQVFRVGEVKGCPYLVSELVRGKGLDELDLPLPWLEALEIGLDLSRGLAAAHRRGVVHRDVKPANAILTDEGRVKLLDFGIAKLLHPERPSPADRPAARVKPSPLPTVAHGSVAEPTRDLAQVAATAALAGPRRLPGASASTARLPTEASPTAPEDVTRPGLILGTPSYMAPEVWDGAPATFASDVYSLGALLYMLCAGAPPHSADDLDRLSEIVMTCDARPLSLAAEGADGRFAEVVDRCLARDPAQRYASANEVRAALTELTPEGRGKSRPEGNPYRGLLAFEGRHRSVFFGRDSETRGVLERLVSDQVVIVAGDSGVGKSSLCRAGVLPRVGDWLDPKRSWSTTTMVPGPAPVVSLAAALAPMLGKAQDELLSTVRDEPAALARDLRAALGAEKGLVLFVDQLEELATLGEPDEAAAAAHALAWLAQPSGSIRLIAAVRGDFLGRIAGLPPLSDLVSRSLYFLRPLSRERIREAIVEPAAAAGLRFESEALVEELVESTIGASGGLPLLQFALCRLWDVRDVGRATITAEASTALGGVAGALALHADEVVARMPPLDRKAARHVLLRLVTADGTRARRSRADLAGVHDRAEAALDALVRGRIVAAGDNADGATYEIAHEALLRRWPTLAAWVGANVEERRLGERLELAVAEWERHGRSRELLWSGPLLFEARSMDLAVLPAPSARFLRQSRRAATRLRARRWSAVAALPLLLIATYVGFSLRARAVERERVGQALDGARADLSTARGQSERADALEAQAWSLFDSEDEGPAEGAWARSLAARREASQGYVSASQWLEQAVMLDRGRTSPARALLAAVLLDRAILAERARARAERDELLRRMALYDDDGGMRRRWDAPAALSLESRPAGAHVLLERNVREDGGRLRREPVDAPPLPWTGVTLPAGSYLLTFDAPGRAPVRLPIALGRAEELELVVAVPPAESVPPGFVHVPAGTALFGSSAAEPQRRDFFHAVPLHPVATEPFLVAVHEVTFGDWISYLEALPEAERAARAPRVGEGGFSGSVALERLVDGAWQLTFQPTTRRHAARSGERIVYAGREAQASVDWLQMPVVGISATDAEAYARWLDESGRVPGARLCTEIEWERAARGADDRAYPHGDVLDPADANYDETYGRRPEAMGPEQVGSHPASTSPFGLADLAGNVWEWTRQLGGAGHAARGGSFYYGRSAARIGNRETPEASFRDVGVGLRLCANAPP